MRQAGKYQVYAYFPKTADASSQTALTLHNGTRVKEITLGKELLRVEGQTAGAWVPLGEYAMPAGRKGYVEISNKGADGVVVADACCSCRSGSQRLSAFFVNSCNQSNLQLWEQRAFWESYWCLRVPPAW